MDVQSNVPLKNEGYCCICEAATVFVAQGPWLRDQYQCERCGTIPRVRAVVEILNYVAPDWRLGAVHESSPVANHLACKCPGYSFSFFYNDVPLGASKDGNRCENLEALTFRNDSFDVFITQDVLEHVLRPDRALAEIMRVLRPGGVHVFTAPKHQNLPKSMSRVSLVDGRLCYLLPPEYHGNPIDAKGSLVTWDYGIDFELLIQDWSGYCTSTYAIRDRQRGIDGEHLEVFVTRKTAVNWVGSGYV